MVKICLIEADLVVGGENGREGSAPPSIKPELDIFALLSGNLARSGTGPFGCRRLRSDSAGLFDGRR